MRKKLKTIVLLIAISVTLSSCGKTRKVGTYEAEGKGRNGNIRVSVTIDSEGDISDIELIEHEENKQFIEASFDEIRKSVIRKNNYDVDTISGATQTSNGIIEGIKKAVEESQ